MVEQRLYPWYNSLEKSHTAVSLVHELKSSVSDSAPSSTFSLLSLDLDSDPVYINAVSDFDIINYGNFNNITEGEVLPNIL